MFENDQKKDGKAFTLIELIIVITVILILSVMALPNFYKAKEHALDKEASANLKLIAAAEKIYKMEIGSYVAYADTSAVNSNLKLFIPAGDKRNWNYLTKDTGCAQATRVTTGKTWRILITEDEPGENLTCP